MKGRVKISDFVDMVLSVIDTDPEYFYNAFQHRFLDRIATHLGDKKNSDAQAIKLRIWEFLYGLLDRYPSTKDELLIRRLISSGPDNAKKNQILDLLFEDPKYEELRNGFVDHQVWAL